MDDIRLVRYLIVGDFWRFRIADDGDTIHMDAAVDEQGEYTHLAVSFPAADFIGALQSLGAKGGL